MRRILTCVLAAAACAAFAWAARPGGASDAGAGAQKKGQRQKAGATPTPTPTPTPVRKLQAPADAPKPNSSNEEKREPKKSDKPEYNEDDPAVGPNARQGHREFKFDIQKSLTGTFTLVSVGESPQDIARRATLSLPEDKRAQAFDALMRRLLTPERLAIEQRGGKIKIASTAFAPVTLETNRSSSRGTPPSMYSAEYRAPSFAERGFREGVSGGELVIRASGLSNDDFFRATFRPVENGNTLSVTREVSVEGLPNPVLIQSFYARIADKPKFDEVKVEPNPPEKPPSPTKTRKQ